MDKLDCDSVLTALSDYLDSDARDELCRQIEGHLKGCKDCSFKVDTVRKMIILYQNGSPSSIEMPVRLIPKLAASLAQEYGTR